MAEDELFAILAGLVDAWCGRRALRCLRFILPGYPMPSHLTDSWQTLLEAMQNVRALCRDDLTEGERESLGKAIALAEGALRVSSVTGGA